MSEKNQTVAILGAGIIGVNCAYELQKHGYDVTLIDKTGIGEGCSKGNAGHFATEQVFPLADPALLCQLPGMLCDRNGPLGISLRQFPKLAPWFARFTLNMRKNERDANTQALRALNEEALRHYKTLVDDLDIKHLLTNLGSLLLFETTSIKKINEIAQGYRSQGVSLEVIDRQQCLLLEPSLSQRVQHAIYFTDVAHTIEPYVLCKEIGLAATQLGAKLEVKKVDKIEQLEREVRLTSGQQQNTFDHLVIAAGVWSKSLLQGIGYNIPLAAEGGYHYQLGTDIELNRPIVSAERKFIITPMSKGIRLAGTVEFSGLKSKPNFRRANALFDHAKELFSQVPNKLSGDQKTHQWHGHRPSLPDSLPVIGRAPKHQSIYFALGHQHLGLTQGAITGRLIRQSISDQPCDVDLTPFCVSRFN